jgi:hypothetical protein
MAEYSAGPFTFPSKQKALDYLSDQLEKHHDGQIVEDQTLARFLTELVSLHDEAEEKIGPGISHWVVTRNNESGYRTRGFSIAQEGGIENIPFGYSKVIRQPGRRAKLAEALTQEAIHVTREFRERAFAADVVRCADTGAVISDVRLANAVHRRPARRELHQLFMTAEGLTEEIGLVKANPGSGYRLEDRELAERWVAFQQARMDGMDIVLWRRADSIA